ncbi:MAG: RNA polymerase sigma-70 factor [Bacteroidales bacterium]|nr:RNA polymerase sigma-70 factor [Bacteroidales bacterium]MDD4671185.1 RNA polymerase sigma-70 factor [Bacteroidales bacterium]
MESVTDLIAGKASEYESLFVRLYPVLVNYASRLLMDKHISEDIVMDIFFNLWDNRSSLENIRSIDAYLYRTTYNKCIDTVRHKKIVNKYHNLQLYNEEIAQTPEMELDLISKDYNTHINQALNTLPPKCREVFILRRFYNFSYKQIGEKLDISVKTVDSQLRIANKKLKEELGWLTFFILFYNFH